MVEIDGENSTKGSKSLGSSTPPLRLTFTIDEVAADETQAEKDRVTKDGSFEKLPRNSPHDESGDSPPVTPHADSREGVSDDEDFATTKEDEVLIYKLEAQTPVNFGEMVFEKILRCATWRDKKWNLLFPSLIFNVLNAQHPIQPVSGEVFHSPEPFNIHIKEESNTVKGGNKALGKHFHVSVKDKKKGVSSTKSKVVAAEEETDMDREDGVSPADGQMSLVLRIPGSVASSPVAQALHSAFSTFQTVLDAITGNQN